MSKPKTQLIFFLFVQPAEAESGKLHYFSSFQILYHWLCNAFYGFFVRHQNLGFHQILKHGEKIIHWLPVQKDLVKAEILMPDKKTIKGIAEPMVKNLKAGEVVQFARFGFCRLDKKEKNKLSFWFTHK